ncbi:hypothetical protein [Paraburkholderia caballeronis]|nr:hypothetical protein [Paraburkholderia caballeronis]
MDDARRLGQHQLRLAPHTVARFNFATQPAPKDVDGIALRAVGPPYDEVRMNVDDLFRRA